MESFGNKLKFFAKKRFGSLNALAGELGMNPSYLSRIVMGHIKPKSDFFEKILNLGCDLNWLLDVNKNELDWVEGNRIELNSEEADLINKIRSFQTQYGEVVNIVPAINKYIDNQKDFQGKTIG